MRKYTQQRAEADALGRQFQGFPSGYSRWKLCDDLSAAREPLGLDSDALWLLIFYIKHTQDQDWSHGGEPVVAWPKFELCCLTGWSEDKLSRVEARLCDSGFMVYRDAPNCKRRAFRGEDGWIDPKASGVSLAPCGARAMEIQTAAYQKIEETRELRNLFGELFEWRATLLRFLGHAQLPKEATEALETLMDDLPRRRHHLTPVGSLRALKARAKAMYAAICAMLGLEQAPAKADTPEAHSRATTPQARADAGAGQGGGTSWRKQAATIATVAASMRRLHRTDAEQQKPESKNQSKDQDLLEILAASPVMFRGYLEQSQCRTGAWEVALGDAAERYASALAVQPSLVRRMQRSYGWVATLRSIFGLGAMTEKGSEIRNPCGYALRLAQKAANGSPYRAQWS